MHPPGVSLRCCKINKPHVLLPPPPSPPPPTTPHQTHGGVGYYTIFVSTVKSTSVHTCPPARRGRPSSSCRTSWERPRRYRPRHRSRHSEATACPPMTKCFGCARRHKREEAAKATSQAREKKSKGQQGWAQFGTRMARDGMYGLSNFRTSACFVDPQEGARHPSRAATCGWTAVKAHVEDAPVPVWHLGDGTVGVRACQEHKVTHSEDLSHTPTEATEPTQLPSCRGVEKAHGGMGKA